jgi:hypothetical protein
LLLCANCQCKLDVSYSFLQEWDLCKGADIRKEYLTDKLHIA